MNGIKKLLRVLGIVLLVLALFTAGANALMVLTARSRIVPAEQAEPADCILVLGCGLFEDGTPGRMLSRRLDTAIDLYKQGLAPRLLMSGDHGTVGYDEVNAMKRYAVERGVPAEDVFMDHAGFCTWDSMVRAREIFGCERVLIVTQPYHQYRAVWDAQRKGMRAQGVNAPMYNYGWRYTARLHLREIIARAKDAAVSLIGLPATVMGDPIDLKGSGAQTDDAATQAWLSELAVP